MRNNKCLMSAALLLSALTQPIYSLASTIHAFPYSQSSVHACCCRLANFNGFYAGVKGGGSMTSVDGTSSYSTSLIDSFVETNSLATSGSWNKNRNSLAGSLFVGYGGAINNFYLGGELFANFANRNTVTNTSANSSVTAAENYNISQSLSNQIKASANSGEYGVDVKPGFLYGNTLIYLRAGLAYTELTLSSRSTLTYSDFNIQALPINSTTTRVFSLSSSKHIYATRIGLGIEKKITDKLGVTLDYIYTDYGDISVKGATPIVTPFGTVANGYTNSSKITLKNHAGLIGLTYKFC